MFSSEERDYIVQERMRQGFAHASLVAFRQTYYPDRLDVAPADFHHRWSNVLLHGRRHSAFEAFRESGKTQIVIRGNLGHVVAFPQQSRSYIVIICATQHAASKKLNELSRSVAADMMRPAEDRELSAMVETVVEASGHAYEVRCRNGVDIRIEAYGKGSAVRGLSWRSKRPDIVVIDDPQDAEDARSETTSDSDWDWFLSDILFLGQNSRIFLIGNNLGERCIIERVIAGADNLGFDVERVPIMVDGVSTWPDKYPAGEVLREMEDFSSLGKLDVWYREKMCQAISPDSQRFKREYFRYYKRHDLKRDGMNVYVMVDLASSKAETADRTAVVVLGVNHDGHWFVLDVIAGRFDPTETIDAIFRAVERWKPREVGIESVQYQAVLAHFLQKEMPRRNRFFTIHPLLAKNKKEERIDAIQPRFYTGTVWFCEGASWCGEIEKELLAFPRGLHDDIIDALAYGEQLADVPERIMDGKLIPAAGRM